MKNKNLVLKAVSAVAGVLGVIFGFLVNFDFKIVNETGVYWLSKDGPFEEASVWNWFKTPGDSAEVFENFCDKPYKSVFKIIGAVALVLCLVAVLVLVASLVVELLNKKCEVLNKVAKVATYVLAALVLVLLACVLLYKVTNTGKFIDSTVTAEVMNLVMLILSLVFMMAAAVCAFFANRKTK